MSHGVYETRVEIPLKYVRLQDEDYISDDEAQEASDTDLGDDVNGNNEEQEDGEEEGEETTSMMRRRGAEGRNVMSSFGADRRPTGKRKRAAAPGRGKPQMKRTPTTTGVRRIADKLPKKSSRVELTTISSTSSATRKTVCIVAAVSSAVLAAVVLFTVYVVLPSWSGMATAGGGGDAAAHGGEEDGYGASWNDDSGNDGGGDGDIQGQKIPSHPSGGPDISLHPGGGSHRGETQTANDTADDTLTSTSTTSFYDYDEETEEDYGMEEGIGDEETNDLEARED